MHYVIPQSAETPEQMTCPSKSRKYLRPILRRAVGPYRYREMLWRDRLSFSSGTGTDNRYERRLPERSRQRMLISDQSLRCEQQARRQGDGPKYRVLMKLGEVLLKYFSEAKIGRASCRERV